jgi:hypothetical protein
MALNTGTFNAIRASSMSVKYEYIGRLDISSGNVTCGLNYTAVSDPAGVTVVGNNGLYPDPSYSILSALEDCPFARTLPITDTVKSVFVPQDYTLLNLKAPTDASATGIYFYLRFSDAPEVIYIMLSGTPITDYC